MTEQTSSFYSSNEPVFPKRVKGRFRSLKWVFMALTLSVYYLTPWLRWDRGPELANQAILVDLTHRRFYFFWIEIWPHEFYFIAGLLIMAGLGLFLITSALGRAWCGYACPQTIWSDLFLLVERWIEGDRNARLRLFHANWSFRKLRLRIIKWLVWLLIGVATGGAWVFYFADAPTLFRDLVNFQASPVTYSTIGFLTAATFTLGGFAREQVCIYMCPWPRIQAAMIDDTTLTVGYRDWRGEPRGKLRQVETGDCIDCKLCVAVCPMGIDIRNGQQLECITCALCIDACDGVMHKLGYTRGLIDYLALSDEPLERRGQKPRSIWRHLLQIRTLFYTFLWALIGLTLIYALFIRVDFTTLIAPIRNPNYILMTDGSLRNAYHLKLRNQSNKPRLFKISVKGDPMWVLQLEGSPYHSVEVAADQTLGLRAYVTATQASVSSQTHSTALRFWFEDLATGTRSFVDTTFNGRQEK